MLFRIVIYVRKTVVYLQFLIRIECIMHFCKNERPVLSIISYSPDIDYSDNFNFKYSRGKNYWLDFMSYIIYYTVK